MSILCDFVYHKKNFSLRFKQTLSGKDITAITGPSGSGKTTLLRLMMGLEKAQNAKFVVNQETLQDNKIFIPTRHRHIGYVGQESTLFPFLNAKQNLLFAQKRAHKNNAQSPILSEFIEVFDIKKCLEQRPKTLSTGEQQRVALIQSLLNKPKLFLFDEALSAIDEDRKKIILEYLKQYLKNTPVIYVSHDENELSQVEPQTIIQI